MSLLGNFSRKLTAKEIVYNDITFSSLGTIYKKTEVCQDNLEHIEGICCYLSQPGDGVFGHWIMHVLPRLWFASQHITDEFYLLLHGRTRKMVKVFDFIIAHIPNLKGVIFLKNDQKYVYHVKCLYTVNKFPANRMIDPIIQDFRAWLFDGKATMKRPINSEKTNVLKKVFLSRGNWKNDGRLLVNRTAVEAAFEQQGYDIISPEKYPLSELLTRLSDAQVIAGERGSALHISLLLPSVKHVLVLGYDNDGSPMWPAQYGIGTACDQETTFLFGKGRTISKKAPNTFTYEITLLELDKTLNKIEATL